jgi:hypothetical protein
MGGGGGPTWLALLASSHTDEGREHDEDEDDHDGLLDHQHGEHDAGRLQSEVMNGP